MSNNVSINNDSLPQLQYTPIGEILGYKLIIDPTYQREYILRPDIEERILTNILSNNNSFLADPIVMNYDSKNNTYEVMNGRQRITLMIKYRNNELGILLNDKVVFYNKIITKLLRKSHIGHDADVMTFEQRKKFDGILLEPQLLPI